MELCIRCKNRWFLIGLQDGAYHSCFLYNKNTGDGVPFLISKENYMDPGAVPGHLPALTQIEEMLIARCHV
jgi:hypothetical protein